MPQDMCHERSSTLEWHTGSSLRIPSYQKCTVVNHARPKGYNHRSHHGSYFTEKAQCYRHRSQYASRSFIRHRLTGVGVACEAVNVVYTNVDEPNDRQITNSCSEELLRNALRSIIAKNGSVIRMFREECACCNNTDSSLY